MCEAMKSLKRYASKNLKVIAVGLLSCVGGFCVYFCGGQSMSFTVRHGFERHSTLRVQRGDVEKGGQPLGSQASGSPAGQLEAGGSEGRIDSRVLTSSPITSTGLTCKNEDLHYVQGPVEPGRKAE